MGAVVALALALVAVILLVRSLGSSKQPSEVDQQHVQRPNDSDDEDRDAWEGSFWEAENPFRVSAVLKIDYTDANQRRSTRTVDVRQIGVAPGGYLLIGHCQLRNETRTFRTDRIRSCIDVETGEIIADVYSHLKAKYENSPERSLEKFLDTEVDVLRILLFLGKADGQLRAAEKIIIRETCLALATESKITDKMIDSSLKEMDVPSLQAFRLAVGRCAKRPEGQRRALVNAAERMVATQKAVHPAEAEALESMRSRLGTTA